MTTKPSTRRALFAEIVEQHGPALSRLSAGYEREPARREELLQEIWLALWGALEKFRGDASLRTWMVIVNLPVRTRAGVDLVPRFCQVPQWRGDRVAEGA